MRKGKEEGSLYGKEMGRVRMIKGEAVKVYGQWSWDRIGGHVERGGCERRIGKRKRTESKATTIREKGKTCLEGCKGRKGTGEDDEGNEGEGNI